MTKNLLLLAIGLITIQLVTPAPTVHYILNNLQSRFHGNYHHPFLRSHRVFHGPHPLLQHFANSMGLLNSFKYRETTPRYQPPTYSLVANTGYHYPVPSIPFNTPTVWYPVQNTPMTAEYTPVIPQTFPSSPMIPSQSNSGMHIAMQMPTPGTYPDGGQTLVMEPVGEMLNPDLPAVENPSVVMVLDTPEKLPEQPPTVLIQTQPEVPAPVPEQPLQPVHTLTEFKPTPPPVTESNVIVPLATTEAPLSIKIEIPTTEKVVVPEEPTEDLVTTEAPKVEAAEAEDAHVVVNTITPTVISPVEIVNQEPAVTVPPTLVVPVEQVNQEPAVTIAPAVVAPVEPVNQEPAATVAPAVVAPVEHVNPEPAVTVPPTVVAPVENVEQEAAVTSLPESREEPTTVVVESRSDDVTEKAFVESREEDLVHTTLEPESRADDTTEQATAEPESRADDATEKAPESRSDETTEKLPESRSDDTTEKLPESRSDDTTEKIVESRTDDTTEKVEPESRAEDTTEKVELENKTDDTTKGIVLEEKSETVEEVTDDIQTIAPSTKEISDNELD